MKHLPIPSMTPAKFRDASEQVFYLLFATLIGAVIGLVLGNAA